MKRIFKLLTLLILPSIIQAQQIGNIKLKNIRFERGGNEVHVKIELPLEDFYVYDDNILTLFPSIKQGMKEMPLPKVVLKGSHIKTDENAEAYISQTMHYQRNICYRINVPYKSWMDNARLLIKKHLYKSDIVELYAYTGVLKNTLGKGNNDTGYIERTSFSFQPDTLLSMQINASSNNQRYKIIYFYFPDMRSNDALIMPSNYSKLDEVYNFLNQIVNNSNLSLEGIYITGYTSPEGIYYNNEQLAKKRVQSVQSCIETNCRFSSAYIETQWIGEDWAGLIDLIDKDDNVPSRNRILQIIDNVGIFKGREKQLMNLDKGTPYRYMRSYLFPQLQKVECRIIYNERLSE
ncbi:MAG: OmpA family protein [Prevotella sp.]|jgi:hypothetical protein|nr:OmpA family protein [Prevotella sp.]